MSVSLWWVGVASRYYPLKELLPVDSSSHLNTSSTSWGSATYAQQDDDEVSNDRSWTDVVQPPGRGDMESIPDNDEAEWNPRAHVLATVVLWSSSLGFALLFHDVSVVLAFSGESLGDSVVPCPSLVLFCHTQGYWPLRCWAMCFPLRSISRPTTSPSSTCCRLEESCRPLLLLEGTLAAGAMQL